MKYTTLDWVCVDLLLYSTGQSYYHVIKQLQSISESFLYFSSKQLKCFHFYQIIERTAIDHPHHTMFILLALANAEKDNKFLGEGRREATTSRLTRNSSKGTKGVVDEVSSLIIHIFPILFYLFVCLLLLQLLFLLCCGCFWCCYCFCIAQCSSCYYYCYCEVYMIKLIQVNCG